MPAQAGDPGKSAATTCYNFGIVGTQMAQLDPYNVASGGKIPNCVVGGPAWVTDCSKLFLDYAKAVSPDLLVIKEAANDGNNFTIGAVTDVLRYIKTWSKIPDVVFVTSGCNGGIWPSVSQGQIANNTTATCWPIAHAEGLLRSFVKAGSAATQLGSGRYVGLVDIGRHRSVLSTGYDPESPMLVRAPYSIAPATAGTASVFFPWSWPTYVTGYGINLSFGVQGQSTDAGRWSTIGSIILPLSAGNPNGLTGNQFELGKAAGTGNFVLTGYTYKVVASPTIVASGTTVTCSAICASASYQGGMITFIDGGGATYVGIVLSVDATGKIITTDTAVTTAISTATSKTVTWYRQFLPPQDSGVTAALGASPQLYFYVTGTRASLRLGSSAAPASGWQWSGFVERPEMYFRPQITVSGTPGSVYYSPLMDYTTPETMQMEARPEVSSVFYPAITDQKCWGYSNGAGKTGGMGSGHNAAECAWLVHEPVLRAQNWGTVW